MDELERRLRGEHDAVRDAAPQSGPEVYGAVRAGARRRRVVRGTLTTSVAVVAVGVLGIGAWGLVSVDRAAEPAVPDFTASPTPMVSDAPSPAPSTPASAESEDPRFDDSPDGIAEDALPELAADRGYLVEPGYVYDGHEGLPYPSAHVMEDWVWDAVGERWALSIASLQRDYYDPEFEQPTAVMYLESPEGVTFELFELPDRAWDDARVVSWREDQGTAMVWWAADDENRWGHGGAIDLRTGVLDDLAFGVYGEGAHDIRFITANAQGDELWRAESEAGFKYYRWSDGADDDGWVASALVDQSPDADDASGSIGAWGPDVSKNGDLVLLRPVSEVGTVLTLISYSLSTDSLTTTVASVPQRAGLMHAFYLDATTIEATLEYPVAEPDGTDFWENDLIRIVLGGSAAPVVVPEGEETRPGVGDSRAPVRFGEPSPLWVAWEECGC